MLLQRLIATSTAAVTTTTQVNTSKVGRGHIILIHQRHIDALCRHAKPGPAGFKCVL